jgi:hypothetical protein
MARELGLFLAPELLRAQDVDPWSSTHRVIDRRSPKFFFSFSWWEESFALHAIVLGAGMMLSCNSCPDGLSGVQPNEEQVSP